MYAQCSSLVCIPVRSRTARPSRPQPNIDHTGHAHGAVSGAEVIIRQAAGKKSDAVLRASIGENPLAAVHLIGRTKPSVSHAINAASNTVAVTRPSPAHGVPFGDVEYARHEGEALPYCDIVGLRRELLARRRTRARSRCWSGRSKWRPDQCQNRDQSCDEQEQGNDSPQPQTNKSTVRIRCHIKLPINRPERVFSRTC
jgi:hypothetical protein